MRQIWQCLLDRLGIARSALVRQDVQTLVDMIQERDRAILRLRLAILHTLAHATPDTRRNVHELLREEVFAEIEGDELDVPIFSANTDRKG